MSKIRNYFLVLTIVGGEAFGLEPPVIFERVAPSVWVVNATVQGRQITASAVVVAPGRLMTNCHVVAGAKVIQVKKDNTSFDAALEFSDGQRDLCQLVVRNFFAPALPLAPMGTLKVGQRVYAINSPSGEELSINEGMVSSLRKATDGSPLIQTTVPVTHGSSGGGLFDAEARLVGITTYAASQGPATNFAQPADWIQDVPERAKAALAARAPTPAAAASLYPRQLTGEDLVDHFARLGRVDVKAPTNLMSLSFPGGNGIAIRYFSTRFPNGSTTRGTYRVSNDQVCFRLPAGTGATGAGETGWEWMSDCFGVSQTDEKTFSLKNRKADHGLSYTVR